MSTLPEKSLKFLENSKQLASFPIFVTYVSCLLLIPLWKRLLPPLELKSTMIVYNIICVLLSVVASALLVLGALTGDGMYSFKENSYVSHGLCVYTISKNVELLDTMFMILRQRWRQISFLHVFHHSTILILGNYAWVYTPFPPVAVVIGLNSIVHIFLYAYYAHAALGLGGGNSSVWKKRLTQFQIAQFLFDLIFSTPGYLYHGFCIYSIIYGLSMLLLFSNFYYHAYMKRREVKKVE